MITIRHGSDRGHGDHGWRESWHTFSFGNFNDPAYMGFRSLRVMNEDRIAPGRGFGAHAHRDMEIITYILEGSLAHKDNMGERRIIGPNTIQAMSAGTGVVHSEFNASDKEPVHLLQIWIEPAMEDAEPSYHQISFAPAEKHGKLKLLASPDPAAAGTAAVIHQDARVYAAELGDGEKLRQPLSPGRYGWVQVARGSVLLNGQKLEEGDGAAVSEESELSLAGASSDGAEFLLFDLA
jgi:redox-sensitive bicupin YhaK (pirin superfamily)